jgi:hypothetical protein
MKTMTMIMAGVALATMGGVTWFLVARHLAAADVDSITAPPDSSQMSIERIQALVETADFKSRLSVIRQIRLLPEAERIPVLESLSRDSRAEVRALAVSAMEPLRHLPPVHTLLDGMARHDPDADVRTAARHAAGGTP